LVFPQSILRPAQSSCTDDVCGSQSRWPRTADGFAVCGFSATLASYFDIAGGDALTAFGVGPRMPIAW